MEAQPAAKGAKGAKAEHRGGQTAAENTGSVGGLKVFFVSDEETVFKLVMRNMVEKHHARGFPSQGFMGSSSAGHPLISEYTWFSDSKSSRRFCGRLKGRRFACRILFSIDACLSASSLLQ